jgi:hypothetical protein
MVRNGDRRSIGNSASLQVRSFLLKWQYFTNCRNIILSVATGHHNHTPAPQNKETASSSFANCASLEASYPNFFILTDPLVQRGGDVSVRFTTNSHLCEKVLGPVPVPMGQSVQFTTTAGHGVVEAKSKSSSDPCGLGTPCLFLASNDKETHPAVSSKHEYSF